MPVFSLHSLYSNYNYILIILNLFFFTPLHFSPVCILRRRFRVFCHWLVNHSTFGNVILLCIMCSSALLAVEKPIEPPGQVKFFFHSIDILDSCFVFRFLNSRLWILTNLFFFFTLSLTPTDTQIS